MTVATVERVAERFLAQQRCAVLALKGAWGVGKTYAWKRIVERSRDQMWPKAYSYVSLFGVASLAALRVAILANSRPAELLGQTLTFDLINRNWSWLGLAKASQLWARISGAGGSKLSQGVTVGFDALAPMLIRDMVVCLDDFERLSTDRISHEELMGFISNLKEEAGCKIVIILNEQRLPEGGADYLKYHEKVIDLELRFSPTAAEAIFWGLSPDLWERQRVEACAVALDIRNVRILQKISEIVELLKPILRDMHEQVKQTAIPSAVLLTWSYFDTSGHAPPLSFLHNWNTMTSALKQEKEEPTAEEARWDSLMSGYRFHPLDEIDLAIERVILQGYTEESGFAEAAEKLDVMYKNGDKEQRFIAAWNLFHRSFENNEAELVEELQQGLREGVRQITPANLSGTLDLLRKLGREVLANDLLAYYMEHRADEPEIFNLAQNPFADHVTDGPTKEAFEKQAALSAKAIPLRDAVESMGQGHGWSVEQEEALAAATADDLYQLFKGQLELRVAKVVNVCLNFRNSQRPKIAERAVEALRRIAGESTINRIRVKRYGIDIETPTGDPDTKSVQGGAAEQA